MSLPVAEENPWAEELSQREVDIENENQAPIVDNNQNKILNSPEITSQDSSQTESKTSPRMITPKQHKNKVKSSSSSPKKFGKNLLPAAQLSSSQQHQSQRLQRSPSRKVSRIKGNSKDLIFGVCIVNFHHLRGPEIEYTKFHDDSTNDFSIIWPHLPFQALPDGAHSFEETFSYFTLYYNENGNTQTIDQDSTTLFAISCVRQIRTEELLEKDEDITRSSVQKAVVVILRQPIFGQIKEKLSIVTNSFFEQKNFNDKLIVDLLYDNLQTIYNEGTSSSYIDEMDFYSGISLRSLIKDFKKDVLVILKAMILEKKIAFYGSNPTKLCQTEFAFISLLPNLINNLLDSSSPELDNYSSNVKMTTSFQTSDRNSVLDFAGFPLQIFGKNGVFAPFAPLQQFEDLKKVKHYIMGTSNALILNQKSKLADVLINIDNSTVEIIDQELNQPLTLTNYDKKWLSIIINNVTSSWNDSYSGYIGSDDYIRWQFEDYLIGLLSSVKYDNFIKKFDGSPPSEVINKDFDINQLKNFNLGFIEIWKKTSNYKLFNKFTDDNIFDVFEPKHIYVDENKSLSEKFQQFKLDNSKKFEDYKKGFLNKDTSIPKEKEKESKDKEKDLINNDNNNNNNNGNNNDSNKKLNSPGKIWSWYSRKKESKDAE
ncbi:Late secretory pathway protein avl9 [Wickerhamomyces ciferrii]|uniref:Late secretory pathway protein avl9 n=1 Tax=Wickerhamomyces ciferrii (strain ATCC 14091 / BCRC 22168 / CBS 111 / JCM 3599 / NBRC 0793 / NRRL Y-1031 F-60-10) TaxID=1206466 RepID=K0KFG6_WICCF|nr:Late secretory pathway protein avl9 [Wickerhamomyces ciferrii]CCH41681.1 Late secretory pathway protein avl9 [Wickerhamomyces ciferrii]